MYEIPEKLEQFRQPYSWDQQFERIGTLQGLVREIAYAVLEVDSSGRGMGRLYATGEWAKLQTTRARAFLRFDDAQPELRKRLFEFFLPRLGDAVEQAWQQGKTWAIFGINPQLDQLVTAGSDPTIGVQFRFRWLRRLAGVLREFPYDAHWLLENGGKFENYSSDWQFGVLLAGGMALPDRRGEQLVDEVREVGLRQAEADGDRHALFALLASPPEYGWDILNYHLTKNPPHLRSYRSVLNFPAIANPETLRLVMRRVLELELHCYPNIARIVSAWFGWVLGSDPVTVGGALRMAVQLIDNELLLESVLASRSPEQVFVALRSLGLLDLRRMIVAAKEILGSDRVERRLAAAESLRYVDLPEVDDIMAPIVDDSDARIANIALAHLALPVRSKPDLFESILRLSVRSAEHQDLLRLRLWNLDYRSRRHSFAHELIVHLDGRSPKLLLPYLGQLVWHRLQSTVAYVWKTYRTDDEVRNSVLELIAYLVDAEFHVVVGFLGTQRLRSDEILWLERLGRRRSLLRHNGIASIIAGQGDATALNSVDRLLASDSRIHHRLGLYILWKLAEKGREPDACRDRALRFAARRGRVHGREKVLIRSIVTGRTTLKQSILLEPD